MRLWRSLHIKVKWAALGGALGAFLTAVEPQVGSQYPTWVATALTALSAVLAGYAAPGHGEPQDEVTV